MSSKAFHNYKDKEPYRRNPVNKVKIARNGTS